LRFRSPRSSGFSLRPRKQQSPPHARLAVAVLSGRHPGQHPFEGLDIEPLAGEVLLIKDPGHFAIDAGLLYVVATAVVGDLEDFEGEIFRPRFAVPCLNVVPYVGHRAAPRVMALICCRRSVHKSARISKI
jgi:hypothetical protein